MLFWKKGYSYLKGILWLKIEIFQYVEYKYLYDFENLV